MVSTESDIQSEYWSSLPDTLPKRKPKDKITANISNDHRYRTSKDRRITTIEPGMGNPPRHPQAPAFPCRLLV